MQINLGEGIGLHTLGPQDWRGEARMKIPRAPKPADVVPPRGYVPPELERCVFDMARNGKTIPEIAKDTGLIVSKVRNMLLRAGIAFKLARPHRGAKKSRAGA